MKFNRKPLPPVYFSYGSNINQNQMAFRCPTAQYIGPFYLKGWELEFGNHANIRPRRYGSVPGALWYLTDADIAALDRYEGYPTYYKTRRWNQDGLRFFFYEMTRPASGTPSDWYVQGILEGYEQSGLNPDYLLGKLKCQKPQTITAGGWMSKTMKAAHGSMEYYNQMK